MPSYKWNKKKIKIPGSSFLSAYHRPWHTNVGVRLAAMVFGLFALTLYSTLVQANAVRVTFLDQTPPNIVPQGQNTITYTIQTENFNDGGTPSSIGVGIQVLVNGSVVSADSGEFTTSDCRVDPLYPTAFACNSLSEGGRQTINLTWNNPDPGTSTVSFRASCQLLPVQNPPVLCSTFGTSDSTITTVEAPLLQFQNSNFTVNENGGSATIFVTRSGVSTGAVTVGYSVYNGTATAGSDFQSVNGTLSWADGDTSAKSFDVPILDDILVEGSETVNLRLYSPGGGAALGNPSNAVLTINDVENGEIAFTAADYTVSEDGNTATIDIQRTGGSDGSVSVQFTSANGSATAGSDYTDSSTVVTWAAGESGTKSITIPIIDDTLVEGDETVNLSLSNPTGGARLGTNSAALLTIADVENGELQLSSSSYSVSENGGTITIDITRASGSDGAVTVQYATSDGTATAGSDYTSSSGTVSWAAGETGTKTFSVTIVNDVLVEGDETIIIALSNPTGGARLGTNNSATLTIVDVENGEIQFGAPSYSVREDGNLVSVEVIRSGGSDGAVSVQFTSANGSASAGSDYTDSSAPVNWADGESGTKIINIPILDDNIVEGDETINLTLTAPTNGARLGSQNASVVTITDVEHGVIQLDSLSYSVEEIGGVAVISLQRSNGGDGAVSVDYATNDGSAVAGSDYTASNGTVSWNDGETGVKTIEVPITDDNLAEADETFNIALSNVAGGAVLGSTTTAEVTIVDGGIPGTVQFSAADFSISENSGSVTVSVNRTNGTKGSVSVDYSTSDGTATVDSDYTAVSASLSWQDGESGEKTFVIPIINDNIDEQDESFTITLSNITGGATLGNINPATVTITDDDVAGALQFGSANYSVAEDSGTVAVEVTRLQGSSGIVTVQYSASNGTAVAGEDYTAVNGMLTWADGDTASKTIEIPILNDNVLESDETFTVSISNATGGATLGSPNAATVLIADSGAPGTLQFGSSNYSVDEDGESVTVMVTRANGSNGQVSVDYAMVDGTAAAGSDYTQVSGTLTWGDGDATPKTFSIPILMDDNEEPDETVTLTIGNPIGGATLGSPASSLLTIINKTPPQAPGDPAGMLQFGSPVYTVGEEGGQISIEILRVNGSEGEISVSVSATNDGATSGSDYTLSQNTFTWANGDSQPRQLIIIINDDDEIEGNQSFSVTLGTPTGGAQLGSITISMVTILDDETSSGPVSDIRANSGNTISRTFTVSNANPGIDIAATIGAVEPQFVSGTSGKVTYSFSVPPTAALGDVFTDTITITDSLNNQTVVPVTITVSAALAENPAIEAPLLTVAEALDELCLDTASQALASQCDNLAALSEAEQADAIQKISPRQIATQAASSVDMSTLQINNIRSRVLALRSGAGGLALNGLTIGSDDDTIPAGMLAELLLDELTGGGASADKPLANGRLGVFLNGKITIGERDATTNQSGIDFDTKGLTLGMDYRFTDQFFLGSALGYGATNGDYSNSGGGLDSKAASLSIFGSYYTPKDFYLDWIFGYSGSDYHTSRNINFTNVNTTAEGDTKGNQLLFGLNGGADFYSKSWLFGGYARLDYIQVQIDSYSESGGSGFGLNIQEQTVDSLRTALGGKISRAISQSWGVISPSAYVEWEHEYKDDGRLITATFVEDSRVPFAISTDDPDRDYFNLGVGTVLTFPGGSTMFVNYETMAGHDVVRVHSIDFGVRVEF